MICCKTTLRLYWCWYIASNNFPSWDDATWLFVYFIRISTKARAQGSREWVAWTSSRYHSLQQIDYFNKTDFFFQRNVRLTWVTVMFSAHETSERPCPLSPYFSSISIIFQIHLAMILHLLLFLLWHPQSIRKLFFPNLKMRSLYVKLCHFLKNVNQLNSINFKTF